MKNKKNEKQKKVFVEPETEIIKFEAVDLIADNGLGGDEKDPEGKEDI